MKIQKALSIVVLVVLSISLFAQPAPAKTYQPCLLLCPMDYSEFDAQTDTRPTFEWTAAEKIEVAYYVFKLHHSVWDEIIQREVIQIYTYKTKDTKLAWPSEIPFEATAAGSALFLWEVYPVDIQGRIISNQFDSPNAFSVINNVNMDTFSMIDPIKQNPREINPE